MRSSAETYLSYAPPLLLRRLQSSEPILPPDIERFSGTVVLIDVERFSFFAERMSHKGNDGVEQLATRINETFASVVEAIERYGGVAHSFPGDSVIALWTTEFRSDEDACLLAARCSLELVDSHRDSELPLKAGLAAGQMSIVHVGGIGGRLQLLLSGEPLDGMGRAEERSSRGRLIVTAPAWQLLANHAVASVDSDGFYEINSLRGAAPPAVAAASRTEWQLGTVEAARAYLPSALLRQLDAGHAAWLGEFREVSTVFIQIRVDPAGREDDFVRVQESFREIQRVLYRHGGDITRFAHDDKGMAVLAVFGLPPASSEDSAARAVSAAVEIDQEAPRFRFRCRVGIATGRVFCGTLGAPRRREFSVVGSTPNLAARFMQSLESGVLCDAATMEAAGAAARFEPAGRLRPKGFPDPMEVFRPVGTSPAARIQAFSGAIVGREKEMHRLHGWIDDLRRAMDARDEVGPAGSAGSAGLPRRGPLAVVEGEAGVGKTTLVRDAIEHADHRGLSVLRVACEAVQSSSTYASWAKVITSLLRLDDTRTADERTRRVIDALGAASVAEEMFPLVAPVLHVELEETATTREMSGSARADNLLALLARLISHLALQGRREGRGLMLLLEDVHWLDPASWELLGVLTRSLDSRTLGILVTLRSETTPTSSQWHGIVMAPDTERIVLSPLSREDTRRFAQHVLHATEISPQLLQVTFERTRGNPFFCAQLLNALTESGLARVEGGVASLRIRNPEQAESLVPRSIAAVLTSRLDRLPAPVQLTLKAASVIGARFRMDVLGAIHPMRLDSHSLVEHLLEAAALGLIESAGDESGVQCFQHAIMCDVAYGLLLASQRRQLHREAAEYLGRNADTPAAQAVLFYHWRRSGDEERALEHVDHAGAEAMRNGDYHAVIELYGYALQTVAERTTPAHVLEASDGLRREALWSGHLGEAQVAIGLHEAARSNLEMALELLGESGRSGRMALVAGVVREAIRQLTHRVARRRFEGSRAAEARSLALASSTYEQLGFVYYSAGETLPGIYAALRILNLAELAGLPAAMARSYAVMSLTASLVGSSWLTGLYDRRAVELSRRTTDPLVAAYVGWITGLRAAGEGKWDLVAMRVEPAQRVAEHAGDRRLSIMSLTVLAWPPYVRGEFTQAADIAERVLAIARESNNRLWEAWGLNGLAEPALMNGDYETATRCCQRALAVLVEESDQAEEIRSLGLLAWSLRRQGRLEESYTTARRALDRAEAWEVTSYIVAEGLAGICEVMLAAAEEARARTGTLPTTLHRDSRRAVKALTRYSRIFPMGRPRLHIARARLAMIESSHATATTELERACRSADELGMQHAKGLALLAGARCAALEPAARRQRAEEAAGVLRGGDALRETREILREFHA
jgi:class 3 adenylate cyclase/tetratricopeptide (TPR) repeat protein